MSGEPSGEPALAVRADRRRCCGAGRCAALAPAAFDQDAHDGTVIVLLPRPPRALQALVVEAASLCPTGAIAVEGAA
jgi:ferredoxin